MSSEMLFYSVWTVTRRGDGPGRDLTGKQTAGPGDLQTECTTAQKSTSQLGIVDDIKFHHNFLHQGVESLAPEPTSISMVGRE